MRPNPRSTGPDPAGRILATLKIRFGVFQGTGTEEVHSAAAADVHREHADAAVPCLWPPFEPRSRVRAGVGHCARLGSGSRWISYRSLPMGCRLVPFPVRRPLPLGTGLSEDVVHLDALAWITYHSESWWLPIG